MSVRRAHAADEAAIRRLLESVALPVADVTAQSLQHFLVKSDATGVIGVVGLDIAGDVALLRSLAVAPAARGRGLGNDLVAAAEALAAERGVRRIFLLTTTADAYFAARGYRIAARDEAPEAVRRMPQFQSLCPASAVFMARTTPAAAG